MSFREEVQRKIRTLFRPLRTYKRQQSPSRHLINLFKQQPFVKEVLTIGTKCKSCNAGWILVKLAQSFFVLSIPYINQAITTAGSKGTEAEE